MNNILALRSASILDLMAALDKGGWTNTTSSKKIRVGDLLVVYANKTICKSSGVPFENQRVLVGQLTEEPFYLDRADDRWPSKDGLHNYVEQEYLVFFPLKDMRLVSFSEMPAVINAVTNIRGFAKGGRYLEFF